jgi:hypothetical protein
VGYFPWKPHGSGKISDISPTVKEFVRKHIDSVHALELLLLVRRYEERAWSSSELSRELYTSALSVEDNLRRFQNAFLVSAEPSANGQDKFRYAHGEHDGAVDELIEAYRHYRVRVIDTIFSKSSDSLKDFSNAFRLKREGDEQE